MAIGSLVTSAHTALTTFTATATQGLPYSTSFAIPTSTKAAAQSILDPSHPDPARYNPADPIVLFVIQVAVILAISRFLHIFLGLIRQPRVVSEILGGILLGPTAFGQINGFTSHIFPAPSLPYLALVANLGLILFLFLIGLEVDFSLFRKNIRVSASVAVVGLALPFGLGCAVSIGLYHQFIDQSATTFPHFMLFIGTSMSITAFPVLARILTELGLMTDRVGVIVLAAGVANDVVGWILLALTIALVNASSGITVLYIILCAIGWVLVLFFIVRPVFHYLVRTSGSLDGQGPTQTVICASIMLCLVSAWVTDQIGVNAVFGGFLAGLVMPRSNGFASHLTEKVEDLVTVLFIPIFFAESGLKTNLTLLDSGIIWGWTVCVIGTSFTAKFVGCASMARWCGYSLRESAAVGSLMSCKGLIELIVLSLGLQAGVINDTVFSIFVLEALLLTFTSTPLTLLFYPSRLRSSGKADSAEALSDGADTPSGTHALRSRITVVLERLENLGAVMVFTKLIASPPNLTRRLLSTTSNPLEKDSSTSTTTSIPPSVPALCVDVVRLVELTDRTSAVMQASETDTQLRSDPLSSLYTTFTSINGVPLGSTSLVIIPKAAFAESVAKKAKEAGSDLIVIPWTLSKVDSDGPIASMVPNPFEAFFDRATGGKDANPAYAAFVRDLFAEAHTDLCVFVDRGATAPAPITLPGQHHLFLGFFGGADDRTALELVLQLVERNFGISATVVRIVRAPEPTEEDGQLKVAPFGVTEHTKAGEAGEELDPRLLGAGGAVSTLPSSSPYPTIGHGVGGTGDTVYPGAPANDLQSETADDVLFEWAKSKILDAQLPIALSECATAFPLRTAIVRARSAAEAAPDARLTVVAGRGRVGAMSHRVELTLLLKEAPSAALGIVRSGEVRRSLGEVGSAMLVAGVGTNLLLLQSRQTVGVRKAA